MAASLVLKQGAGAQTDIQLPVAAFREMRHALVEVGAVAGGLHDEVAAGMRVEAVERHAGDVRQAFELRRPGGRGHRPDGADEERLRVADALHVGEGKPAERIWI